MTQHSSLVLFDIDGTLMRGAGDGHKAALVEGILRVTGRATSLENVPTAGMLDGDLISGMLRVSGHNETSIREILPAIMRECAQCYVASCSGDLSRFLCQGVKSTLARLAAEGVALGIVSGNLSHIGWRKIELAGLRHYFSLGAFAENGSTRAELARIAAERARESGLVRDGGRVSLIGDHANDVAAAQANGFQSVAVATGVMSLTELAEARPDILLSNLEELKVEQVL